MIGAIPNALMSFHGETVEPSSLGGLRVFHTLIWKVLYRRLQVETR